MASGAPDYTLPATIASGQLQVIGGANKDVFSGSTNADGATWTTLTPTVGRTVISWTIKNTSASVTLDVGLGASVSEMQLGPGESWSPPWNGPIHLKSASAAACSYKVVAVEV